MNLADWQEPIDPLHAQCKQLQEWIRREFRKARANIQTWEPRPVPRNYK